MMYKTIIFDFFGVIYNEQYNVWLTNHHQRREGAFAELSKKADKGEISIQEFFEGLSNLTGMPKDKVKNSFAETGVLNLKTVELIRLLKARKYKLGLLSNSSAGYLDQILESEHLFGLFDQIIISGNEGIAKPDPKIYKIALDRLDVTPQQTIFIDDGYNNIKSAQNLGIQTILFMDIDQTIRDLDKLLR